jgi:hypothetical protein
MDREGLQGAICQRAVAAHEPLDHQAAAARFVAFQRNLLTGLHFLADERHSFDVFAVS